MKCTKISLVLVMAGVMVMADKPPTGPQVHHFTGQPGYDSFGKSVAPQPIYGGPSHDIGVAHHPVSYGHAPSGGGPVGYQTAYIAYEAPQPAPQYYVKVKSNPLKDLDKKIKDYASKFTKFITKGFKKDEKKGGGYYGEPSYPIYPTYQPVQYHRKPAPYHPKPAPYHPKPAPYYPQPAPAPFYPQRPTYGSYH